MRQVAEPESVTAQPFESAADRLDRPAQGRGVEVRQHVGAAPMQRATKLGEFVETVRTTERIVSMTRANRFLLRRLS